MAVVLDSNFWIPFIQPKAHEEHHARKIDYLISDLAKRKIQILVPTPVLWEVLTGCDEAEKDFLEIIKNKKNYLVAPFDYKSATSAAKMLTKPELSKIKEFKNSPWQQIKIDHQICAIAKVYGAEEIYSNDKGMENFCAQVGMLCRNLQDLPSPPPVQKTLVLDFDPLTPNAPFPPD